MATKLTDKERAAIKAMKDAIRALPRNITITIDDHEGVVEFWKAVEPGVANGVDTLRCKRAVQF